MKYAILLNSEVTEEYDNLLEAEQAYKEYVKEEGDTFDFSLVLTLESHEAPASKNGNDYPVGRHYSIDYGISDKDIDDADKEVAEWLNERFITNDKKVNIKERVQQTLKRGRRK